MNQGAPPAIPKLAHDRIAEMREHKLFTCDLSINEFLLVREAGFDPLGLVMGTSIYQMSRRSRGSRAGNQASSSTT